VVLAQELERSVPKSEQPARRAKLRAAVAAATARVVRLSQRNRRNRGYAFSQGEGGEWEIMQKFDSTKQKPAGL
jgi:hypothetical protein